MEDMLFRAILFCSFIIGVNNSICQFIAVTSDRSSCSLTIILRLCLFLIIREWVNYFIVERIPFFIYK